MRTAYLLLTVAIFSSVLALAQTTCTSQPIGTTVYTTCSDGTSTTSQQVGNTTFHSSSDGTSGTSQQVVAEMCVDAQFGLKPFFPVCLCYFREDVEGFLEPMTSFVIGHL